MEYGEAFAEKYDKLNQGVPIGNVFDTIGFLGKLEMLKERSNRCLGYSKSTGTPSARK